MEQSASSVPASTVATAAPTPGELLEASLPDWQRAVNRFCENWIFAFIVAMAVRHFAIEAFRIPSASMEPMLYGDPAFMQSDQVVVDKLITRLRGVHRWDVTVFQFPQPEIRVGDEDVTAYDDAGERRDNLISNPLSYRNFVKRAVVLPGDTFYIANGDLFLKRPDGTFTIERKPAAVQEAVWQDLYRHDAAPKYLPWRSAGGAGVATRADGSGHDVVSFQMAKDSSIEFTQPLRNLYLKPGKVAVRSLATGEDAVVEASMVAPEFSLRSGAKGNVWDLDKWELTRLTSADLDSGSRQTVLNRSMREYIGDVRVAGQVIALDGWVVLRIAEGDRQRLDLRLSRTGWQLDRDGGVLAHGDQDALGGAFSLASVDDQVVVQVRGVEVARCDIAATDPQRDRTAISWYGEGSIELAGLHIQRDLHYSAITAYPGFLAPTEVAKTYWDEAHRRLAVGDGSRGQHIADAKLLRDMTAVRAEMRGKPIDQMTAAENVAPWAYSPQTAATAPAGAYLLLGDNSPQSWDGRGWGWVPERNLRGRVLAVILWPQRWHIVH